VIYQIIFEVLKDIFLAFIRSLFEKVDIYSKFLDYFKNLLSSDGILSSLQFGFTALLTLLVATGISLYETRKDPEYEIDKTVISKVLNLKKLLVTLIIAIALIFLFNPKSDFYFNSALFLGLIYPFIYLVEVNYKVIDCLTYIKKYRKNYLLENKNGQVLDFWEEYFKRLENQENNAVATLKQREKYKYREEESGYIKLFFEKIDKLDFKQDAEFAANLIQVFLSGFDNINFDIFFYESWILDKLLSWHKESWKNYSEFNKLRYNSVLQRALMELINKILEKSLIENGDIFSSLIKKIDKHIEENYDLSTKNKRFYVNDFNFHQTILNNLHKSNFLYDLQNDDSDDYFLEKWRIINKSGEKNNKWWCIIRPWFFNNCNYNFSQSKADRDKISAVIKVFFNGINPNYFSYILAYWRSFSSSSFGNYKRITQFVDLKLFFPDDLSLMFGGSPLVSTLTICKELGLLPTKEKVTQDLEEIEHLEKASSLNSTQKHQLQTIKEIWTELKKQLNVG